MQKGITKVMRVGVVQMRSTDDPFENLLLVQAFVDEAHSQGCDLVCFPENVFYRGPRNKIKAQGCELRRNAVGRILTEGPFSCAVDEFLQFAPLCVSLGSVIDATLEQQRPTNSHWFWHAKNKEIIAYDKLHLFCFKSDNCVLDEGEDYRAGEHLVDVKLGRLRFGLSICYDLRFPELYRHLFIEHQANVLLVPAAFLQETGEKHWHVLLRSRAIENLCYVLASAQWGVHFDNKGRAIECYGHSLIVDPWGQIIAEGPAQGDALLVVDLDEDLIHKKRTHLPALQHNRLFHPAQNIRRISYEKF